MTNELSIIESILRGFGVAGIPTIIIYALWKRYLVLGWQYLAMEKERDYWRTAHLKSLNAAELAATIAEKHITSSE